MESGLSKTVGGLFRLCELKMDGHYSNLYFMFYCKILIVKHLDPTKKQRPSFHTI